MIKEKDEEIQQLMADSKINKLNERNRMLLERLRDLATLNETINLLKKTEVDITNRYDAAKKERDYHQKIYSGTAGKRDEQEKKLDEMITQQQEGLKRMEQKTEKQNSLKFKLNVEKSKEKERDKEIYSMKYEVDSIEQIHEDIKANKTDEEETKKTIKELISNYIKP